MPTLGGGGKPQLSATRGSSWNPPRPKKSSGGGGEYTLCASLSFGLASGSRLSCRGGRQPGGVPTTNCEKLALSEGNLDVLALGVSPLEILTTVGNRRLYLHCSPALRAENRRFVLNPRLESLVALVAWTSVKQPGFHWSRFCFR